MYYRLNDIYALRSYKFANKGIFCKYSITPLSVGDEAFELLKQCDGEHDLPETDMIKYLLHRGIISQCKKGEHPSEWSAYRKCENRFVRTINLMITGKCNYNCRHCFDAAENADRMDEWDWGAFLDLLDQASECGIHCITLTGGEPMIYPRFMDAVREICKRNMVLEALTTNGYFITEEVLDEFIRLDCRPEIKISYDGIGHHDYMRGHKGAEERTLAAFELCHKKGFSTFAQTQVYPGNIDCIKDTLQMLDGMGVNTARLIRTTSVPRWQKNEPDGCIPMEEYFDKMLDIADWYMHGEHQMNLHIWQYMNLYPKEKKYDLSDVRYPDGVYRPTKQVCMTTRTVMSVTCEGDVVPCIQMSGYGALVGMKNDNLKNKRLKDIIEGGSWHDSVCMTLCQFRKKCEICDKCKWFNYCGGGCRALAMLGPVLEGKPLDYTGPDPVACLFYKGGWYDKARNTLKDFQYIK